MRFLCITYSDYKRVENINFGGYYAAVGVYGEQWHLVLRSALSLSLREFESATSSSTHPDVLQAL
jgi:hypothetical protein